VCEFENGELAAFILYRDVGEAWEISFLATVPAARGQGIMNRLLMALIGQKPADRAIWLEVHESNEPALKLYAKVGFHQVGHRPRYYKDGGAAMLFSY
jgi:ribosomal-protein-alanine N-acetyltransferase